MFGIGRKIKKNLSKASKFAPLIGLAGTAMGIPALTQVSSALSTYDDVFNGTADNNYMSNQYALMDKSFQQNLAAYGMRHQLEVNDLRKAGLNPILSANSGASIGTVSTPTAINTNEQANQLKHERTLQRLELKQQYDLQKEQLNIERINAETQRDSVNSSKALNDTSIEYKKLEMDILQTGRDMETKIKEAELDDVTTRTMLAIAESASTIRLLEAQRGEALSNAEKNRILAKNLQNQDLREKDIHPAKVGQAFAESGIAKETKRQMKNENDMFEIEHKTELDRYNGLDSDGLGNVHKGNRSIGRHASEVIGQIPIVSELLGSLKLMLMKK